MLRISGLKGSLEERHRRPHVHILAMSVVCRRTPAPRLTRNTQAPQGASEGDSVIEHYHIPLFLTKHVEHPPRELSSGNSCSLLNLDSSISDL